MSGRHGKKGCCFVGYALDRARRVEADGHRGTAKRYRQTAARLQADKGDVPLAEIDRMFLESWIEKMRAAGLAPNTIDFYFRGARALFRRAAGEGVFVDRKRPFDTVRTKPEKTRKRALTRLQLSRLMQLPLSGSEKKARDMFLLTFFLRGIPPVDLYRLRKCDVRNGVLSYRRAKTGQLLEVRVESEAADIIRRYPGDGGRLLRLPCQGTIGSHLRDIGERLGLPFNLTLYCARHTWATLAHRADIPVSVISRGLGHSSEGTTRIYLAGIESGEIDRYNRLLLDSLK